jgi:hypothetical protein
MRLLHLAPASAERAIRRSGVRGRKRELGGVIVPAVFAMPVLPSFQVTHQWTRELRRFHDQRLLAVVLRVPDDEPVWVGPYVGPHRQLTAARAARWVSEHPDGAELIVPRSLRATEVVDVRPTTQLIGWRYRPDGEQGCVCAVCLPGGRPEVKRKIRGVARQALLALRTAQGDEERRQALCRLDGALERVAGEVPLRSIIAALPGWPTPLRRLGLDVLGRGAPAEVAAPLVAHALRDADPDAREQAAGSLVHCLGAPRALAALGGEAAPIETLLHLIERISYRPARRERLVLERLVGHADARVAAAAREALD